MTGIPSIERRCAIEGVLKAKEVDYYLLSCSSHSTLRSILFELCRYLTVIIDVILLGVEAVGLIVHEQIYWRVASGSSGGHFAVL